MKRFLTILLAGLLIVAVTAPAIAWEFNMKGEFEHRFRYLGRTGQNDLFGRDGAWSEVGFAGPNIYGRPPSGVTIATATPVETGPAAVAGAGTNGLISLQSPPNAVPPGIPAYGLANPMRIIQGGYSNYGSDAIYHDTRLTFHPEIRVNPAIRVHGVYTVGGLRNKFAQPAQGTNPFAVGVGVPPFERYYAHQTSDAAFNTAAIGSWEQFRATIQLPWGIWSVGVKDFPFGLGSTLAYNTRAESFLWVIPYGPFRFLWPIWLARNAHNAGWGTHPDKDFKSEIQQGFAMQYLCGDLDMGGGLIIYQNYHVMAAYDPAWNSVTQTGRTGFNVNTGFWGAYFKYNNGRFFANAEYMFNQTNITPAGYRNLQAIPASLTPKYNELYHWFAELGAMAGPAKVTFMAATASGPVLNYENPTKVYGADSINYQAMEPYEWLMFNTYGGGNDRFNPDGHGEMSDAFCYAARVDYAVASNLNVWASYIWAHRLEKQGFLFGGKTSSGFAVGNNDTSIGTFAGPTVASRAQSTTNIGGVAGTTYGYATDGYLGWEANAGVDWKLLEGMTMFFRYAYWQPGDWFKEAYQARGAVATTANLGTAAFPQIVDQRTGVLETRDAINAFSGSIMINF